MSGSWAQRHADLSSEAGRVLTALVVLGVCDIEVDDLAAGLAMPATRVAGAVTELRRAGWIAARPADGTDTLVDAARIWLTYDAPDPVKPDVAADIAGRFLDHQLAGLDPAGRGRDETARWAGEHRTGVITAIRAGVRAGLPGPAAKLAAAAWRVAAEVADPDWWRELSRNGEEASIQGQDPEALIDLLNRSAAIFGRSGDLPTAEAKLVWASKLTYRLGQRDRILAGLSALLGLYRRWPRPEAALNVLLELADLHRRADNASGRAAALAELGAIMFASDRLAPAETYLSRADELLTRAAGSAAPATHARVLEHRGRVLWRLGHTIRARRCFARALDLVAGVGPAADPGAVERLAALLDTHADSPTLPAGDIPVWPPA